MENRQLADLRRECAQILLGLYFKAHAGHIGSSLSCLEILVELCFRRMQPEDKIILSKGHAAAALYTVLAKSGRLDETELATYYQDGTRLAAHPPCNGELPSIPFGTGSLGHGLSLAAGLAFSQRYTGKKFRVYCVVSDGDCNEGATWEAALFAGHQGLSNLTVVVDANGLQGFGSTCRVCDMEPFAEKWRSFGFSVTEAEQGNDFASLEAAFARQPQSGPEAGRPQCIMARTVKGHGVSFMQNKMEWHYLPMSEEQYQQALQEVQTPHA